MLLMFFPGFKDSKPVIAWIKRSARVITDLNVGMLYGMNIMGLKGINLYSKIHKITISSCKGFVINLKITLGKTRTNLVI